MELILREDVQNLGFKDDIVKVKNGYGRNFLIPHGKAVIATSSARKVLAENLKQRAFKEQKLVDDANKLGKKLQGFEIKIKSKVGSGDKLFGSIGSQDVADAFEKNGETIEKKFITLPGKTIKRLGAYEAAVRLHRAVVVQVAFEIIAE
ncbi:MAG: 50S ribosomal protein L9 [Candidatus Arcticimaribacter sp.]|jgi:large subunit ribosomal protein L9|nr:50S ribosomal protein L9 [Flavobacteriaceae bacterium]PSR09000.1 MAG: 50S ribosomal protein L9 [Candidatus Arcticimaribacter sp.]PTL99900.1 MAG: 50S ribosomal protein L9 [Candidatus Arcticimaribacter sp.]|tara:strand:+ start:178 stop:624 length:447 start_codon:yes stop_codon:yes gene_type:complete